MDSDADTYAISETELDSNSDTNQDDTMWDKILRITYAGNKQFWSQLLFQDEIEFQLKFKEAYLEQCKRWLALFNDFIAQDETWTSLMDTKTKLYDSVEGDEEEALFSAIDARRYKIFKMIDWDKVEADIHHDSDNELVVDEVD